MYNSTGSSGHYALDAVVDNGVHEPNVKHIPDVAVFYVPANTA